MAVTWHYGRPVMMTTSRPLRFDRVVTSRHFSFIRLLNSLREWQEVIQPVYIRESPRCCIMISFCIAKATRSNSTFEVGAPTVIFRRRCVFRCCAALCSPRSRSRNLINTILFPAASASGLAYFAYTATSMCVRFYLRRGSGVTTRSRDVRALTLWQGWNEVH